MVINYIKKQLLIFKIRKFYLIGILNKIQKITKLLLFDFSLKQLIITYICAAFL